MADSLKEFYNNSAITYSDLQTGVTLLTNTSTEEAMLKQISLQSQVPIKLKSNNFDLSFSYEPSISQSFEGYEIIPSSSSLIAYTDQEPFYNATIRFGNTSSYTIQKFYPKFDDPLGRPYFYEDETVSLTSSLLDVADQFWIINNDLYYVDSRNRQAITAGVYKRTGLNGTDDAVIMDATDSQTGLTQSTGYAYDGVRYIFSMNGAGQSYKVYDTQTGSTYGGIAPQVADSGDGCIRFDCNDGWFAYLQSGTGTIWYAQYDDASIASGSLVWRQFYLQDSTFRTYSYNNIQIMKDTLTGGFVLYQHEGTTSTTIVAYHIDLYRFGNQPNFYKTVFNPGTANYFNGNKIYINKNIAVMQSAEQNRPLNFIFAGGTFGTSEVDYIEYPQQYNWSFATLDSVNNEVIGNSQIRALGVKTTA